MGRTSESLGSTVAPPPIVPALDMLAVNSYTCVAEFTQHVAIEVLKDRRGYHAAHGAEFAKRREQLRLERGSGPHPESFRQHGKRVRRSANNVKGRG